MEALISSDADGGAELLCTVKATVLLLRGSANDLTDSDELAKWLRELKIELDTRNVAQESPAPAALASKPCGRTSKKKRRSDQDSSRSRGDSGSCISSRGPRSQTSFDAAIESLDLLRAHETPGGPCDRAYERARVQLVERNCQAIVDDAEKKRRRQERDEEREEMHNRIRDEAFEFQAKSHLYASKLQEIKDISSLSSEQHKKRRRDERNEEREEEHLRKAKIATDNKTEPFQTHDPGEEARARLLARNCRAIADDADTEDLEHLADVPYERRKKRRRQSREEERAEHSLEHDARKAKIALDNTGTPGGFHGYYGTGRYAS